MKDIFNMLVFVLFVDKNIVNYDCYKRKFEILGMLNRKFLILEEKNLDIYLYIEDWFIFKCGLESIFY